jgi:ABC-type branched-subunit amino acid transport system substrate-binding protein
VLRGKPLHGANAWPDGLPGFRATIEAYYAALMRLARQLMEAFALSLGLPRGQFLPMTDAAMAALRLLHYPPQATAPVADAVASVLGSAARAETLGPVTDEVGVIRVAKGQPILIGALLVLSGPDLSLGVDASRGAEIAFDDRKNTLLGHPIKYLPEDGQCSVEGGQTGATRLAAKKQIVGVLGTACSSESRGGAPILWNAGMP